MCHNLLIVRRRCDHASVRCGYRLRLDDSDYHFRSSAQCRRLGSSSPARKLRLAARIKSEIHSVEISGVSLILTVMTSPFLVDGKRTTADVGYLRQHKILAKNVIRNVSVDVSQAEVAAGIAVGELCVVKAEQMQGCGVEIVDVELVVDG